MDYLNIAVGVALVLVGRSLFWVAVGLSGFVFGMELVPLFFPGMAFWATVAVGAAAGIAGAALSVFAERIAFGLAGFFIGTLLLLRAAGALGLDGIDAAFAVFGGVCGAVLAVLLTDWAIISLSSVVGSSLIVGELGLSMPVAGAVFLALLLIGVAVQGWSFSLKQRPVE